MFCADKTNFMPNVLNKSTQVTVRDSVIRGVFWEGENRGQEDFYIVQDLNEGNQLLWAMK